MAAIRAVLFDKDGTLVDFERTWLAVAEAMALDAAGGDPAEARRLLELGGFDTAERRFLPDSVFAAGTNADIVALWYPDLLPSERAERVKSFDRFTAREGARRAVALPGLRPALEALHGAGLRLGVATNDSTEGAELTLRELGIASLFSAAYGYDAVANPKPAADPVHAFAAHVGVEPGQIAVIGDNNHDLAMARAAGAGLAVGVLSGTGTRDSLAPLADAVIGSVAELADLLERRDGPARARPDTAAR